MDDISTSDGEGLPLRMFSDEAHDATFHFQILKLTDQLYIWVGCNAARLGHLFAAFPTPFDRTPSLTALIGGGPDNTGASMARRLSMKTGWSIILAINLPSNSPTLEAYAERRLLQELKSLGYAKSSAGAQQINGSV
ncbi:proteasome assembly chaperone 4 [Marchantia polymorpha subsp. ruderalis]|uniref:Proteasome assembly chaperone 4 n=2 Tax=Marchantia polymorpha TaxID=3197 RepID=A0A176W0S0_MARPO|nr:hypothetical protein AXG93_4542s1600 [Marchantia polymorpha subsp. ruderalis]PTQ44206.1 hypothetical protein MARPO_0021s0070 [Marchantia polymorpha]PTQ44207.1 hypothetical protein MARPO_0021s0070 [Marchantia polymorpha]PTQ44208.1 hypothetical protein MARPO_0021s0070 [Marchantia polymorpha]BBN01281.1 hypothetical protein Mp_2g06150 [Marchantia polymorpha subsp. ruderalis]|eukprot:PTQ44206.1 hypothetical protein MARPO_0021s0070 [Marchantia polymorpha]